ncbi:hypothetical protein D3C87_1464170 [compost metagenome]
MFFRCFEARHFDLQNVVTRHEPLDQRPLALERRDAGGIEMAAALRDNMRIGLFGRPRLLVRTLGAESLKDVRNGDDTGFQRNAIARQAVRISRSIPFFVMATCNRLGYAQQVG